jgi:hypothetical protein
VRTIIGRVDAQAGDAVDGCGEFIDAGIKPAVHQ